MQRVLRKTAEQLKEEERQKHEEHEKERRVRILNFFSWLIEFKFHNLFYFSSKFNFLFANSFMSSVTWGKIIWRITGNQETVSFCSSFRRIFVKNIDMSMLKLESLLNVVADCYWSGCPMWILTLFSKSIK